MGDLVNNLIEIEEYKNKIKEELVKKGFDNMDDVPFSGYAAKIAELQLNTTPPSGSSPAPTPSADYIYSNGYLTNGTKTNEIINLIPHEIVLDSEGKCAFELTCPDEISVTNYTNYDIIFTVEIPDGYSIKEDGFEIERLDGYETYQYGLKDNPRYKTIVRDNVTYSSFVRVTKDGDLYHDVESDEHDMATDDAMGDGIKYRLTIIKNNI